MVPLGHVCSGGGHISWRVAAGDVTEAEVDAVQQEDRGTAVHDRVALDEIELYGEVLTAVAAIDRPLTREEIDAVLGVGRKRPPADVA